MTAMGAERKIDPALAASLLDWWRLAGVDALIDEAPRNWLAAPEAALARAIGQAGSAPVAAPAPVRAMPATLAEFETWRLGPDMPEAAWPGARCGVEGNTASGLMIVVECPDRDGLIGGAAGALFDRMLAAIGLTRETIYLVPMATVRPPSGRLPSELLPALGELLAAQIRLAAPRRMLVIGNAPSRAVLGTEMAPARGRLHSINHLDGQSPASVVATFHPRFLLERPAAKADAWRDLQLLIGDLR